MRIGLTSIFVDDQDHAERFYTQVLGFQVKTSAPYRPDERWLSVVSPEEPDGVELALHRTDEAARAFQAASREVGRCCRCALTTVPGGPSGSRPRGWCSSRSLTRGTTAAPTRSLTTPAAT
jgi:catechol 2,3-dioxygenase-like lactoylglutathione lyase family enzyme